MKARIKFRKYGALRFIGHLDVMRFFQKVMRRADIPIAFTGGYSPHMIMSFASPLGIGLSSDGEYFDIELTAPISSSEAMRRMNKACVEGIEVLSFRQISEEKKMTGMTILAAADYLVQPHNRRCILPEDWTSRFEAFLAQPEIRIIKQTKRSEKEVKKMTTYVIENMKHETLGTFKIEKFGNRYYLDAILPTGKQLMGVYTTKKMAICILDSITKKNGANWKGVGE